MSSSPPPVVADRYRLVAPLGQGGMGRVWRATDVVLHREVAIKELVPPPGLTPSERQEMRERSLREARAIARLNNINVVRVFDVLSTDADPWIVMEYVPSRSLQDVLAQDGPFNALRTAEIGLGVLNALRAAHRNGVVHRDVKPGNVLMGADGRVVLTDFGLATVPGDPNVTRTGLVLGSPAYIAPERARDGTAGPAADLWSLGATLYAAVEGQSPFARPSAIATLAALATENVPVARNAGPLKPVLNGLLRKDPAHRINAEEADRLLSRAAGRRSKITFPMSPSMRRPGVGRERPSLPSGPGGPPVLPGSGWATATGSAPVVPTPRPPVAQPPAAEGRPSYFAQGKAQVSPESPRRPSKPLDATRLDTPPVKDEIKPVSPGTGGAPGFRQGQAPRPAPGQVPPAVDRRPTGRSTVGRPPLDRPSPDQPSAGQPFAGPQPSAGQPFAGQSPAGQQSAGQSFSGQPVAGRSPSARPSAGRPSLPMPSAGGRPVEVPQHVGDSAAPTNALRTGFTAADVAANRRKQAAPEHERSLAQATSGFPIVTPRDNSESVQSTEDDYSSVETKNTPPISERVPVAERVESEEKSADLALAEEAVTAEAEAGATAAGSQPEVAAEPAEVPASPRDEASAEDAGTTLDPDEVPAPVAKPVESTGKEEVESAETSESAEKADSSEEAEAAKLTESVKTAENAEESTAVGPGGEAESADSTEPAEPAEPAEPIEAAKAAEFAAAADVSKDVEPPAGTAAAPKPVEPEPAETPEPAEAVASSRGVKTPAEKKASLPVAEERTSFLHPATAAQDRTTMLSAPEDRTTMLSVPEDRTTMLSPPEDRTTMLSAPEEKTSLLSRPPADDDRTSVVSMPPRRRIVTSTPQPQPGAGVPGFNRPDRPAWTPMQLRPTTRRGGVTVFGTTLTRRQAVIGLAIVLTFVLLVGIIVVQAFGDDDSQDTPPVAQGGVASSAPVQPGGGKQPAGGAPSSKPPVSSAPPAAAVPEGWRVQRFSGLSFPVPDGASSSGGGNDTTFSWGKGRQFRIDVVPGKIDPVDYLNGDGNTGSNEVGPTVVDFNGRKAADLEYDRNPGGYKQHVVRRVVNDGGKTYVLTWYTEAKDWNAGKPDIEAIWANLKFK